MSENQSGSVFRELHTLPKRRSSIHWVALTKSKNILGKKFLSLTSISVENSDLMSTTCNEQFPLHPLLVLNGI